MGKLLARAGLLKAGFAQRLEAAIKLATERYLAEDSSFNIVEVHSFLQSRTLSRALGGFLLEGKPIDVPSLAERMSSYVGVPLTDAPEAWPNQIDPFRFVGGFIEQLMSIFASDADDGIIWLANALADQRSALSKIHLSVEEIRTGLPRIISSSMAGPAEAQVVEFEKRYLEHLNSRFQKVTTPGARELHGLGQSLSIAYISLNLKSGAAGEPVRAEQFLSQNPHVVIRGPAGSGKTTLLSWIVTRCAEIDSREEASDWSGLVPFFVPLRKVARIDSGAPTLERLIDYSVDEKVWTRKAPKNWIENVLRKQKRAVLMIDGVDELPASRRPEFWNWLQSVQTEYPGNRIIVTSRALPGSPVEGALTEQWNPPSGFVEAQLQDMSNADVTKFVHHWHDAVDTSKLDRQEQSSLEEARNSLPLKLEDAANRRIRELCNTPLLCAMVCVLHWREEGYLPRYRVDLYDKCCDMLIEARDLKRGVEPPPGPLAALSKNDKEMVLQRLAIEMMHNRQDGDVAGDDAYRIEISREKAIAWIVPRIPSFQSATAREARAVDVLDFLIERTGLLREPATDLIDFPHRTFQEYLAACAAGADSQEEMLARKADDDQWHETIMLAAGTTTGGVGFGRKLIEALIGRGERHKSLRKKQQQIRKTSFALALGCLENIKQQDPQLRQRVLSNLGELVPPRNETDARILSVAGDAAVPQLAYSMWKDENTATVAACTRALRLIGTTEALKALERGYVQDSREAVVSEVCRTGLIDYAVIPLVLKYVKANGRLPNFAPPSNVTLYVNVEGLRDLSIDFLETKELHRLEELEGLKKLSIERAKSDAPELRLIPPSTEDLTLIRFEGKEFDWLSRISSLTDLTIMGQGNPSSLDFVDTAPHLTRLTLFGQKIPNLQPLSSLGDLRHLSLIGIRGPTTLAPLAPLENLASIHIEDLKGVRSFSAVGEIANLSKLTIVGSDFAPQQPPRFTSRSALKDFGAYGVSDMTDLEFISQAESMEELALASCTDLKSITSLEALSGLRKLSLSNLRPNLPLKLKPFRNLELFQLSLMPSVVDETLEDISKNVRVVELSRCPKLRDLSPLSACTKIQSLAISALPKVENLDFIRGLTDLTSFVLENCDSLESLDFLEGLSIEELRLHSTDSISNFKVLSTLTELKTITFLACETLTDLSFLSDLPKLEKVWLMPSSDKVSIPENLLPKIVQKNTFPPWMRNHQLLLDQWYSDGVTLFNPTAFRRVHYHYRAGLDDITF
ncbi:hypothetical protein CU100_12405 [Phyllobacterium endophyticum]|uniref:NACHT domain-containing protein n=2 Tax=Phyllobacterium endophyticum TaxID=1149773 RepID=A0A2P7AW33_9HYPH|nr:hypothetical protein CU100_12405 [Phyllobacterium endophyticum]